MRHITLLLLFVVLFSCKDKILENNDVEMPKKTKQWLNPHFFLNGFEGELSFPLWFSDSLIKSNEIIKITRRIYPKIEVDEQEIIQYEGTIPQEKWEYYFDPNGYVDKLFIYYYFDGMEVNRISFSFEENMDNNGFRKVKILKTNMLEEDNSDFITNDQIEKNELFSIFSVDNYSKKVDSYVNSTNNQKLFLLKNNKYWGSLSVDSIVNPNREDWIVLGSMKKPYKRYKVENKVNENFVHLYQYWNTGVLKERVIEDYPFSTKRSYIYNENNYWSSFIDSIFTSNEFISESVSYIDYDGIGKPIEIRHVTLNNRKRFCTYRNV
jgi:hypothetical protein